MSEVTTFLRSLVSLIWSYPGVQVITTLTILNVLVAVAGALKAGSFSAMRLPEFLKTDLLPWVVVYFSFALLGGGTGMDAVGIVTLTGIVAMLTAKIIVNLKEIGIPIPESVLKICRYPRTIITMKRVEGDEPNG